MKYVSSRLWIFLLRMVITGNYAESLSDELEFVKSRQVNKLLVTKGQEIDSVYFFFFPCLVSQCPYRIVFL